MYNARPNLRWNVEEGPSTQRLPPIPYHTPPTTETTGERSETTADAEQYNTGTEEEEPPVSDFY